MGENSGTQHILLGANHSSILERRINEHDEAVNKVQLLQQAVANAIIAKERTQGKCDGMVELIAEEAGYDWQKVDKYDIDTEKHTLDLTFKADDSVPPEDAAGGEEASTNEGNGATPEPIPQLKEITKEEVPHGGD